MRLGTRWPVGQTPPSALDEAWCAAIARAEAGGITTGSWTLTWLEGYPRVTHDSGLEIGIGGTPHAAGEVRTAEQEDG